MARRRKRLIPGLARKMSEEAEHVSLLTHALHQLRLALNRLSREILVCLALLICLWQLLTEVLSRLVRLFL